MSRRGQKSSKGQPELYDEMKKRVNVQAAEALFPIGRLAIFDHLSAVTVGAADRNQNSH